MMSSHTTRAICIALGIVVCCLIGLPNLYDKFLIARFAALAAGLAILFLLAFINKNSWRIPNTPVFYIYLLYTLLCGCSLLWATNTAEAIFAFATLLLTLLLVIVIYNLLSTHRQLTQKALWVGAAVILVVYLLFALVQLFHVENLSFGQLYRVSGLSGHKNLLAIMLFILSAFLLTAFSIFENKWFKWLSVVFFVIAVTVIVLLKSRAVLLSLMVAGICFGLMILFHCRHRTAALHHCERSEAIQESNSLDCFVVPPRKSKIRRHEVSQCAKRVKSKLCLTLIASIVLVYAFLTIGLRWFADRSIPHTSEKSEIETKMTSTSSLAERCLLWDKTYHIADKHPIVGCGIGNWQIHFPDADLKGLYRSDVWNVNFTKPHNEYLGVLAETGYLGLLLYVIFLVALVIQAFFALCKTPDRKGFLYGAVFLSIFVGCCVNALFDFPNSRIEHVIWMGILMAVLFQIITQGQHKNLGKGWNVLFLSVAIILTVIGGFRLKGEHNTFKMQQAINANKWNDVEHHCQQALSAFYTIDPVGLPLHWYLGKAEKQQGNPQAISSFRKAYRFAPYCKENLNDLGLAEYYTAHDLDKAEYYLKEAIRISPNYVYPYFNLAYIYLRENEPQKAKEVADSIYFDAHKRDVMKADAVFFEPFNAEAVRQKIDADYEATQRLHKTILENLQK